MDRGDKTLYIGLGAKYSIIRPYIIENLWGLQHPLGKIMLQKKQNKNKNKKTNRLVR